MGDSRVGKSSLLMGLGPGHLDTSLVLTAGEGSFIETMLTKKNQQVTLDLWDTAGQERFAPLTPLHFRDAHVAILSHSPMSRDTVPYDLNLAVEAWTSSAAKWALRSA